jgi:hypothetical protein
VIRGGFLDGAEIGADDVKRLAKLPPADVLRAQLVGALAGSLTTVVGLFAAPMRDLVGVIDARIKQLEEQGETAEAPEEPKAEAETPTETEEAPAEEAPADEPTAEAEPPTEEEPAAEEPAAEEPAAEEPQETQEGEEQQ